jgi:hypothetical protein
MKPKNLSKKIRRLEARLQKGAKKLAKLKQKLEAVTKAGVAKKKRKSAARAAETRKRANTSGRTEKKKRRLTPTQTRLRAANRPSAERNGKKKRNLTPERRAQLAAAMKARWAAKRAAVDANKIRRFKPPPLDENVLAEHKQLSLYSCIPMAVEFVLKLLEKLPREDFRLQKAWNDRKDGSFSDLDGWKFDDIKFTRRFPQPRDDSFPLDGLFSTIENELASGRYVIVSLGVPPHYHNYVIYNRLPNGEFDAVTKGQNPEQINDVRARVSNMKGTDILTYELIASDLA